MNEQYYRYLGLSPGASKSEIKKAFRTKVLKYHPDRNPQDPHSAQRFQEVLDAYDVLYYDKPRRRRGISARQKAREEEEKVQRAKEVAWEIYRERKAIEHAFYTRISTSLMMKYANGVSFIYLILSLLVILNFFMPYKKIDASIQSKNMLYYYHLEEDKAFLNICRASYQVDLTTFLAAKRGDPVTLEVSFLFNDVMRVQYEKGDVKRTLYPRESIYSLFPLIPMLMLIPFLNLLFKEPNVRFYMFFFLTVFIGTVFLAYIFFDGGRFFRMIDGYAC